MDCLIPVHLHRVKKHKGLFKQSEWIYRIVASHVNISVELHLLKRVKYTQSQTTLSKKERNINMEEACKINQSKPYKISGLMDDVLSTRYTEIFCISVLLKNGFEHVIAFFLASPQ